jgi:hypothetical protein
MQLGSRSAAAQLHLSQAKANPTCLPMLPEDAWVVIPTSQMLNLL